MFVKKKLQVSQPSHQLMARHIIHKSGKTTLKQKKDAKKKRNSKKQQQKRRRHPKPGGYEKSFRDRSRRRWARGN